MAGKRPAPRESPNRLRRRGEFRRTNPARMRGFVAEGRSQDPLEGTPPDSPGSVETQAERGTQLDEETKETLGVASDITGIIGGLSLL